MARERLNNAEIEQRRLRRRVFIVLAVLLAVAFPVGWFGPRVYSRWQQGRLNRQGRELLDQGEYRKAALCLREVLRLNGGNIEASRAMADLAEKTNTPTTVALRERVCRLQPKSLSDSYAWAATALKFGDIAHAREALALMKEVGPGSAGCYEIEGRIELLGGRLDAAKIHFSEAAKLDPRNEEYQLVLAVIDIQSRDPGVREAARATVETYRVQPAFRLTALRALVGDVANHGSLENALPLAQELAGDPGASFQDHLLRLGIAHRAHHPTFSAILAETQQRAKSNERELLQLLDWMLLQHLALPACEWTKTLPPETVSKPPVGLKVAELYLLLRDWKGLQAFMAGANWGRDEFLRHGFLARAVLENGDPDGAQKEWDAAVALARDRTPALTALDRTARAWGWDAKREKLLWLIAERPEQPKWAFQALTGISQRQGDTAKLYRAWAKLYELTPADSLAKENWVVLSLLLRRNSAQAVKAARELYESNPSDPHLVAIHAFALHTQERTKESLALMRALKPEQLREPSAAAYYGIFLAAEGDADAGKYLGLADDASLLPEEKQLVAQARRSIGKR